jgi:hypothetical protein
MKYLIILLVLLASSPDTEAHHSRAEFSSETREIDAVVTSVVWRNPHVALFADVAGPDGTTTSWRIEGLTRPAALERSGVSASLFRPGDRITAYGQLSRFRDALLVTNILLDDGREVLMDASVARHWSGPVIGDADAPAPQLADAASEDRGLFRVWHPAGNPMRQMGSFRFTEQAMAGRAEWDPVDNPIVACEQPGLPGTLFHPRPIRFSEMDGDILLHHAFSDTRRTIHMTPNPNPAVSHLGYSAGRWEDERTLVIETTRIDYPWFDNRGTIQGPGLAIVERYTLSEDQSRLDLELSIEDPVSLAEPVNATWHFLALDAPFEVYECNVF